MHKVQRNSFYWGFTSAPAGVITSRLSELTLLAISVQCAYHKNLSSDDKRNLVHKQSRACHSRLTS